MSKEALSPRTQEADALRTRITFVLRNESGTFVFTFRNYQFPVIVLTLESLMLASFGLALSRDQQKRCQTRPMRQVEAREWWLWGVAVTVTLVLTAGIVSLTFSGPHLLENFEWFDLKEWVRGLVCLVLLFDIYTLYQQLQLQRIRRELSQRNQLFEVITENAGDMIAVIDRAGNRLYNSPAYQKVLGYSPEELKLTSSVKQIHPEDQQRVLEAATKARLTGRGERLEYR
jgi:PAS domain-containing protein